MRTLNVNQVSSIALLRWNNAQKNNELVNIAENGTDTAKPHQQSGQSSVGMPRFSDHDYPDGTLSFWQQSIIKRDCSSQQ